MPPLLAPRINPTANAGGGNNPARLNFGADPGPAFLRSGRDARWHLKAADAKAKLLPVRVSERGNMSVQLLGPDRDQSNQMDSGASASLKGAPLFSGAAAVRRGRRDLSAARTALITSKKLPPGLIRAHRRRA